MKKPAKHSIEIKQSLLFFFLLIFACSPQKNKPDVRLFGPRGMDMDRVVFIDLDEYSDFDSLLNRIDIITCNDSMPVIELIHGGIFKYIHLINICGHADVRVDKYLSIKDDMCYRNEFNVQDNPEYMLIQFILNPNHREDLPESPRKAVIFISYESKGMEGLPKLLNKLTTAADHTDVCEYLQLCLRNIPKPPPPPTMPAERY